MIRHDIKIGTYVSAGRGADADFGRYLGRGIVSWEHGACQTEETGAGLRRHRTRAAAETAAETAQGGRRISD